MTMIDDVPDTTTLVHVPQDHTTMVLAGETPEEILANASRIADALHGLIETQGLSASMGRSKSKHVEVGGWQAAGAMLGALGGTPLHAETVWSRRADRADAIVYESRCEVRTLAGEVVGAAESLCSSEESNWRNSDEFAIKGMAETRAESRAYRRAIGWVIKLAGYSPTPAEEMPAGGAAGGEVRTPAWAAPVDVGDAARALHDLLTQAGITDQNVRARAVTTIGNRVLDQCGGEFPVCVATIAGEIAAVLHDNALVEDAKQVFDATEEPTAPPVDEINPDQTTMEESDA